MNRSSGQSKWRMPLLRWLFTLGLLITLGVLLDTESLIRELARFSADAIILALVVSVFQTVLSAWRWRYTARRLGLQLPMGLAVREYYLAMFLNQVLPGGVLGDVNRAWRHGRGPGGHQTALHAVMIERLSGQIVMVLTAITAGVWLVSQHSDLEAPMSGWATYGLMGICGLLVLVALLAFIRGLRRVRAYLRKLGSDIKQGLLGASALPVQLGSSVLVVGSYLAVFGLLAGSAYSMNSLGEWGTLLSLCSLLLLAMVVPLTVSGWGVREGAAAVLWPLAGLPAEQGVALSIGYGVAIFLSSLPGCLWVFSRRPDAA